MPTYEYECNACNIKFESFHSISDGPLTTCPECGKNEVQRLVSNCAGVIFKGSGFYQTDYKNKES